jgi:hypothetical protein
MRTAVARSSNLRKAEVPIDGPPTRTFCNASVICFRNAVSSTMLEKLGAVLPISTKPVKKFRIDIEN